METCYKHVTMHIIFVVAVRSILVSFSNPSVHDLDHRYSINPNCLVKVTSGEKHIYGASNYIYPKCLTHSIWPRKLNHQENKIGFVAVSNDM